MKSIILFRHGHAGWNNNIFGKDFDKPLTSVGIDEAKKMGEYLSKSNEIPNPNNISNGQLNYSIELDEQIISSDMLVFKINISDGISNWESIINFEEKIYGGNPDFLLNLINKQNNSYDSVCLIGHEPNFSSFVSLTTGEYKIFYTASMAKINFETNNWEKISFNQGFLDWIVSPGEIK